jgi:ribosomal protein S18 acetylase RimI-like enzyme
VEEVKIVSYDSAYDPAFAGLNYRWIAEHFTIEAHDREILDDPQGQIIDSGGEVFFALVGDTVAGTVAMVRTDPTLFELTKMAVAPEFQGRGIANLLMKACIDYARAHHADTIFLETNSKLPAAISLYKKFGYAHTPLDPHSQYSRANVRMELALNPVNQ